MPAFGANSGNRQTCRSARGAEPILNVRFLRFKPIGDVDRPAGRSEMLNRLKPGPTWQTRMECPVG